MLPVIDQFIFEVDPNNTYIKIKISINLNVVSKKSEFLLVGWLFNLCSLSQYVYISTFDICVNFCKLRNKLLLESHV